jgi:hypothetical protein
VSVFKERVTNVADDVCWGRRRLYSAEVDEPISQNTQENRKKRAVVKMYLKYPPSMERNDAKIDLRSKPEFFFLMRG